MTYVFGSLDLPVFEILFIVSFVLLVGIVFMVIGIFSVLKEVVSMKSLLTKGEHQVVKLEQGIADLKKLGKQVVDTDVLMTYVKENLKAGYTWEQVKKSLVNEGWKEDRLQEIFKKINEGLKKQ